MRDVQIQPDRCASRQRGRQLHRAACFRVSFSSPSLHALRPVKAAHIGFVFQIRDGGGHPQRYNQICSSREKGERERGRKWE